MTKVAPIIAKICSVELATLGSRSVSCASLQTIKKLERIPGNMVKERLQRKIGHCNKIISNNVCLRRLQAESEKSQLSSQNLSDID